MRRRILMLVAGAVLWATPVLAIETDAVLDSVQYRAFRYFWFEANPSNGLVRDRSQPGSVCSIAATGFGLSSICVGIDHGWITRAQGAARVLAALNTFWSLPQGTSASNVIGYRGFFYHFLDMNTGYRMTSWDTELSSIDTALLLAGILHARQFFDGGDATETQIRSLATQIYERVEWDWMVNPNNQAMRHGWDPDVDPDPAPEPGFLPFDYLGYSEAMILYLLALGSPTHAPPNPAATWSAWTSTYNWNTLFGQTYVSFPPLFGHQYTHCWVDFRNKRDAFMQSKGIDYFENSRRATLAQQAYCIANPGVKAPFTQPAGYHATYWGLTAGDSPGFTYKAHGAPPPQDDDGTVTPTAVVSSLPFAPEICRPTIQNLYDTYPSLWGAYGFRDGMNLAASPDWYGPDFLGIDQGPIVMMIENYRTAGVWSRFMQAPEIQLGLTRAGFVSTVSVDPDPSAETLGLAIGPNPFGPRTQAAFRLARAGNARLTLHDVTGREVARPLDGWLPAGPQSVEVETSGLPGGVYWYRLAADGAVVAKKGVRIR